MGWGDDDGGGGARVYSPPTRAQVERYAIIGGWSPWAAPEELWVDRPGPVIQRCRLAGAAPADLVQVGRFVARPLPHVPAEYRDATHAAHGDHGWCPWAWESLGIGFVDGGTLVVRTKRPPPRWWEQRKVIDRAEIAGRQPIVVTLNGQPTKDWRPQDIEVDPIRVRQVVPRRAAGLPGCEPDPNTPGGVAGAWVDTPGGWSAFVPSWLHLDNWSRPTVPATAISLPDAVAAWGGARAWSIGERVPPPPTDAVWCPIDGVPRSDIPEAVRVRLGAMVDVGVFESSASHWDGIAWRQIR